MSKENLIKSANVTVVDPMHRKSKGEKLFDWAVYGGIAGVVTFGVTLWLAGKVMIAKTPFELNKAGKIETTVRNFMTEHKERKALTSAVETTILMQGGNLMIAPVALAEHFKEPLVIKLNAMNGEPTDIQAIEHKPKQTVWSLVEGRMAAWVAVFATIFGVSKLLPDTFKTYKAEFGAKICEVADKPTHAMTQVEGAVAKVETKWFQYGKIAALDVFATAAAAMLLYVGGHFFARRHEEKKEQRAAMPLRPIVLRDTEELASEIASTDAPKNEIGGAKTHEGPLQLVTPTLSVK